MIAEKKKKWKRARLLILLSVVALLNLFPLVWLLDYSLLSNSDFYGDSIMKLPAPPLWSNYFSAIVDGKFFNYLLNSLFITGITIAVVITLSICLGYALIRMKWKGSRFVYTLLITGIMIPIHTTLLPNFFAFQVYGILNTRIALILPYIAFSMSLGLFIMSGFIEGIPRSLEEAAVMDGCGVLRIIKNVVIPLSKPAAVTVATMTFFNCWNEFIMAATYTSSDTIRTLPFAVMNFSGKYTSNYTVQFAVMFLSTVPAIIIFILFNKQMTKGIIAGAIKE
ncbi:carbohydrate ABC transporter permease [Lachnospiraceae bacterium ASD3451]|uniref:carbohydrate ABC transporter permease n=1 Tax=Diplocloster agilis TaxID=2850323 RepID=UPI001DA3B577|nr:carbohydrate ABC transporter permease [Diplocloster agilis]MBU9744554.1 carbohydrate ABC transporter permease [Diplocloster agilis]